jgi:hypothetical protein
MGPSHEEVLEQVAQELQSHIFECESWTMEQLKQVQIRALIESDNWRDVLRSKCRVAPLDDVPQIPIRYLLSTDVQTEDLKRQFLKRVVPPFRVPVCRQIWDLFGDEKAAIIGESFEDYILEGQLHHYRFSVSSCKFMQPLEWVVHRSCLHEC